MPTKKVGVNNGSHEMKMNAIGAPIRINSAKLSIIIGFFTMMLLVANAFYRRNYRCFIIVVPFSTEKISVQTMLGCTNKGPYEQP